MFWQRIGGGVVPAYVQAKDSPRSPTFKGLGRGSEDSQRVPPPLPPRGDGSQDPFNGAKTNKRVSIGKTTISPAAEYKEEPEPTSTAEEEQRIEEQAAQQLQEEMRHSVGSKSSGSETVIHEEEHASKSESAVSIEPQDSAFTTPAETPSQEMKRLSLTIPGAF